jgi:putative SOS response-associated peptidase YedK
MPSAPALPTPLGARRARLLRSRAGPNVRAMCGRYRIKDTERLKEYLRQTFGVPEWVKEGYPAFNIPPSVEVPVIVMDDEGDVLPIPTMMRWGFVPSWNREEKPRLEPNARAETVAEKPSFRDALQKRRCLVPADGFYEWLRVDEKTKYPFDIHLKDQRPFVMAGIYEQATAARPASFAVLTTAANEAMSRIHHRMPVILDVVFAKRWLRPGAIAAREVAALSAPLDSAAMEATPISALVNNAANDRPEVLEPVAFQWPAKPPEQQELF